jgi:dihydrofolate synthase/folylpolyglutamate synthase
MTHYEQTSAILHAARQHGIDPSLDTIEALVGELDTPQASYTSIQIAGTNGKSSTARFLAAILKKHGFRVGLYTSPELVSYLDCFEINGRMITEERLAQAIDAVKLAETRALEKGRITGCATEFELLTAAALWLFKEEQVEYAILEVGMGGIWDATSVVSPAVSVITGVDLDHTDFLGSILEEIAAHKAGIIKSGTLSVLGPGTQKVLGVFLRQAERTGTSVRTVREVCEVEEIDEITPKGNSLNTQFVIHNPSEQGSVVFSIRGAYSQYTDLKQQYPAIQVQNIATATAAAEAIRGGALDHAFLQEALSNTYLPGRFEILQQAPLVLIDAAHNPQSAQVLAQALSDRFLTPRGIERFDDSWVLILGVLKNKDAKGILKALLPLFNRVIITQSLSERANPAEELSRLAATIAAKDYAVYPTIEESLVYARKESLNVIATGSITVAGEVKRLWEGKELGGS